MNIDQILVDLEILGQIKENDKLAVSNIVGATKLFVSQYSSLNWLARMYNGYNRTDSIVYLENLTIKIETSTRNIIEGNFLDMALSLKTSIENALVGITNLKITYINDTEIIARITILTNKLTKVVEHLNDYINTINTALYSYNDVINDNSNETINNIVLENN